VHHTNLLSIERGGGCGFERKIISFGDGQRVYVCPESYHWSGLSGSEDSYYTCLGNALLHLNAKRSQMISNQFGRPYFVVAQFWVLVNIAAPGYTFRFDLVYCCFKCIILLLCAALSGGQE
jgi:hypothetical protein